ncbi:hypothetical protein HZS_3998 [Henneguya salminicola]|nr:hypothetical protein HZS_3998 [Henneguya salminicola]
MKSVKVNYSAIIILLVTSTIVLSTKKSETYITEPSDLNETDTEPKLPNEPCYSAPDTSFSDEITKYILLSCIFGMAFYGIYKITVCIKSCFKTPTNNIISIRQLDINPHDIGSKFSIYNFSSFRF